MANPEIIPCTPFLGERSPTSALIHDMLDHLCYGFGLSGHRNEAMAPAQLGSRTSTDIKSDLGQMVACGNFHVQQQPEIAHPVDMIGVGRTSRFVGIVTHAITA